MAARRITEACRLVVFIHHTNEPRRTDLVGLFLSQLGSGGVGLRRLVLRRLRGAFAVGHGDEVGRHVIAEQTPRA
jgi:hypothetical protein